MTEEKGSKDLKSISLALLIPESAVIQPNDSKKSAEQGKGKYIPGRKDFIVYELYAQHFRHPKETWVQFLDQHGPEEHSSEQVTSYDPKTRNRFIFNVFCLVLILLLVTATFNLIVFIVPGLLAFFRSPKGHIVAVGCGLGQTVLSFVTCCFSASNYPPFNYIVLLLSVIFMTGMTSFVTAVTRTTLVFYALLATTVVVIIIMCFACSSWDFTKFSNYIMVGATAFGVVSMAIFITMAATQTKIPILWLVLTIIGTVVQSVLLVLTIQTIIGGKTVVMSEELYIMAAVDVYTSIISIFLKLVMIFREFFGEE